MSGERIKALQALVAARATLERTRSTKRPSPADAGAILAALVGARPWASEREREQIDLHAALLRKGIVTELVK